VRQQIAEGKCKTALENAKQFHKTNHTAASESLLFDAYVARIRSLRDQKLELEAKSLVDLVRERFPAAKDRLDGILAASAPGGDLSALLQPLNDPELSAERRAVIEQTIRTEITDLAALAGCNALPYEHSLRQAAAALDRAFNIVTSGPVTEEQIALPEVSRRSPLAPWKWLIRAIACFHRGEDDACRECLSAIQADSAPARLVPALRAMLGEKQDTPLKPQEAALISAVSVDYTKLIRALALLDRAFAESDDQNQLFHAIRASVQACRLSAPELLELLKRLIFIRGAVGYVDVERLTSALDGAPRKDAEFFRNFARAMEVSDDEADAARACELWERFREEAVNEGWFPAGGVEVATIYLHMAELLGEVDPTELKEVQRTAKWDGQPVAEENAYYLHPDKLYARACALDPHPESFSKWMQWAAEQSKSKADKVAKQWHNARPEDLEPILHLMAAAQKRHAIPAALALLEKAERIDAVHPIVRAARLHLLAAGVMNHLGKKKPHLAAEKLAQMAALPQSQQGKRPAFLEALGCVIATASGDLTGAAEKRRAVASSLGVVAAECLIFGIAELSNRLDLVMLPKLSALSKEQRKTIPKSLAQVMTVAGDFGIKQFGLPTGYFAEAEARFAAAASTLDTLELRALGKIGMAAQQPKLAWAVSSEGLKRGGATEASFLLLRAQALPDNASDLRTTALAAAALALGRQHRDMEVVDEAAEILYDPFGDPVTLTIEKAREVVKRELAHPAYPTLYKPGPTYGDMLPQFSGYRPRDPRQPRLFYEEDDDDFGPDDFKGIDEDEIEELFVLNAPKGMPKELAHLLFGALKEGLMNGKTPDQVASEIMSEITGNPKKGRGKFF
jgi:hypothetical protein